MSNKKNHSHREGKEIAAEDRGRALLRLTEPIYAAANDVIEWRSVLTEMTHVFQAKAGQFVFSDFRYPELTFRVAHNIAPSVLRRYEELMLSEASDPRIPFVRAHINHATTCCMATSEETFCASPVYREVLAPLGLAHTMTVAISNGDDTNARIEIMRGTNDPAFIRADCVDFQQLVPHIRRALLLYRQLVNLDCTRKTAHSALDLLPMGVLMVDARCQLHLANEAARTILEADDSGLFLRNGAVWCADRTVRRDIRSLTAEAVEKSIARLPVTGRNLRVPRPAADKPGPALPLALRIASLWELRAHGANPPDGLEPSLAVIFVTDPERPALASAAALRGLFDLTTAESAVARRMIEGAPAKRIATDMGIAENTVRSHIKRILEKAGLARQIDFVRLVSASPAWIDAASAYNARPTQ